MSIHLQYEHLDINDRICPICNQEVETEEHVLTRCSAYMIFRIELYTALSDINDVFIHMNDFDKVCFILNDPFFIAIFLVQILL